MAKAPKDPVIERIISVLNSGERQDLIVLIIPSHRGDRPLSNQTEWAGAGLELFAELYTGATAFQTFKGIYKDSAGKVHYDNPILIESYVQRADAEDEQKLGQLLEFAKRMGRETGQVAVGIVINDVFFGIIDF